MITFTFSGREIKVLESFRHTSSKIEYKTKKSIKSYIAKYILAMTINTSLVEYTKLKALIEAKATLVREEEILRRDLGNTFCI